MKKKIDYTEVLSRLGYFRNRANLSAREASFRIDKSELYVTRIENKQIGLKVSTMLDLLEIYNITVQDFFYLGNDFNEDDKNLLELYGSLSDDNKQFAIDFMKKLKN